MAVAAESLEEFVNLRIEHCVIGNVAAELFRLFLGGKFTVEKQIADFQKVGLFGELVDRVTAVEEFALFAVDECDLAFT